MKLTENDFKDFKTTFEVFGTHTEKDKYLNERTVKDESPKFEIFTMWHPLTDEASIAEYGVNINKMYYCILYNDPGIDYNDVIIIRGAEYEVVGIKYYNTHTRVEISRKKA